MACNPCREGRVETPFLLQLERAEIAAAGVRGAAQVEAGRRIRAAEAEALAIEQSTPSTVAATVETRRAEIRARTDAAVAAIEADLSMLEREFGRAVAAGDDRFERAVESIVAAVLLEDLPFGPDDSVRR